MILFGTFFISIDKIISFVGLINIIQNHGRKGILVPCHEIVNQFERKYFREQKSMEHFIANDANLEEILFSKVLVVEDF